MRLFIVEAKGLDEEVVIVRAESEARLREQFPETLYDARELEVNGPAEELFRFERNFDIELD